MNGKVSSLSVQSPIPQKHLSRFKKKSGIYLVRRNETVLYIGGSGSCLYKAIMRLFQSKGTLSHLDNHELSFEVIETSLLYRNIENVLKRHYKTEYNKRIKPLGATPTAYEKRHYKHILDTYLDQTRFEVQGEHKTDSKTLK